MLHNCVAVGLFETPNLLNSPLLGAPHRDYILSTKTGLLAPYLPHHGAAIQIYGCCFTSCGRLLISGGIPFILMLWPL